MDTFSLKGTLAPAAGQSLPGQIQGGAVYEGAIYLASDLNCSVWAMSLDTGDLTEVIQDVYPHRPYVYEMEGIDFFDLRDRPGGSLGLLHLYGNFMEVKEKSIHNYSP